MASSNESFQLRYEAMDTNELTKLYCDGGLTNDAELVLADVLRERGIVPEELLLEVENKAKAELAKKVEKNQKRKIENKSMSFFDLQRVEELETLEEKEQKNDFSCRPNGINGLGFTILALSFVWCAILLIRTKSVLGQKFLMISGSNIWNAKAIELGENAYLMLWLVGITGICLGLWSLYSSFVKQSVTTKEQSEIMGRFSNAEAKKQCPMCAELVMKEAKICKHCRHKF